MLHDRPVESGGWRVSIRRLGGNRAGETRLTRFLRHAAVSPYEMSRTAGEKTADRCQGRHVLAIQDTTVVRSQGGGLCRRGVRPPRRLDRLLRQAGPVVMLHGWLEFQAAKRGIALLTHGHIL